MWLTISCSTFIPLSRVLLFSQLFSHAFRAICAFSLFSCKGPEERLFYQPSLAVTFFLVNEHIHSRLQQETKHSEDRATVG